MSTNADQIEMILGRRSIRRYRDEPVPLEMLMELLDIAGWAPSAHNRQPWRFAVIGRQRTKKKLARAMGRQLRADLTADGIPAADIEKDAGRSFKRITSAPALILVALTVADMDVYPDQRRQQNEWLMAVQSAAMAGQNLMLAAYALGLGTCWLCGPLFCPDVVRKTLSLPADWQPQGLITIGYPAEKRVKERRPIGQLVKLVD